MQPRNPFLEESMEPTAATTAAPTAAPEAPPAPRRPVAQLLAELRELAASSPARAQRETWDWIRDLGAASAEEDLDELFGLGTPPPRTLEGPTDGILVTTFINPAVDLSAGLITRLWMPWQGKSFDAAQSRGINLLTGSTRWAAKLLWPRYETREAPNGRAAFEFETGIEPGRIEPAVDVLKIDYEPVESNPGLIIRQIRDELVELVPSTYLGRILWRQGDGGYTNIGYFALRQPAGGR
jgi:hypothetical protein